MTMNYMLYAYEQAVFSPDKSSQNGAVIVRQIILSTGHNAPPPNTPMVDERPAKYMVIEHAERAAIYNSIKNEENIAGTTMICPWAACCDCARAIILSGIRQLIVHRPRMELTPEHWKENVGMALMMLQQNYVDVLYYDSPIKGAPDILVDGKLWSPETLEFKDGRT